MRLAKVLESELEGRTMTRKRKTEQRKKRKQKELKELPVRQHLKQEKLENLVGGSGAWDSWSGGKKS